MVKLTWYFYGFFVSAEALSLETNEILAELEVDTRGLEASICVLVGANDINVIVRRQTTALVSFEIVHQLPRCGC